MLCPTSPIFETWAPLGFIAFDETIWTSALEPEDLQRVQIFLRHNGFDNCDASLVRPADDAATRGIWINYFTDKGQPCSTLYQLPIPQDSNHLRMVIAFKSEQDRLAGHNKSSEIVNLIRFVFGVSAARRLSVHRHFSAKAPNTGSFSELGFASVFDGQHINRFRNPPVELASMKALPAEANILLDKAFDQPYPNERFILMWLAFEAVSNALPGNGTNGHKRKSYFKDDLGSALINSEVSRLFGVRNDMFKEGRISGHSLEEDCWSLYMALQLALMQPCELRLSLKSGYEKFLSEKMVQGDE